MPLVYTPNFSIEKSAVVADGTADKVGDVVNYTITVKNTGNITLTGVTVSDKVENYASVPLTLFSGDTDGDNKLDLNETWVYKTSYTLTQDDFENNGGGDGKLNNVATGDTAETDPPKDAKADVPLVIKPDFSIEKSAAVADGTADKAGDVVNYTITVKNTGNVSLSGVTVSDKVENYASVALTLDSGDTDTDGKLDTNETWIYKTSYTLTQDDLDNKGGGDSKLNNVATGDTAETDPPKDAKADVPLVYTPNFSIEKSAVVADGTADKAGDVVNYTITVKNTGNITLTGVIVSDKVESYASVPLVLDSGDADNDGKLDLNETWIYKTSYTLTQDDLDNKGGGDGKLNNVATGDTAETDPPKDAKADVPLVYTPNFSIEKSAVVADGTADKAGDVVNYTITVKNTGNITLTGVTVSDKVESYASVPLVLDSGDADNDGKLDLNETWIYKTSYTLTQDDLDNKGGGDGKLNNVATGDTAETDPPKDAKADVPLVYTPNFSIEKSAVVADGTADKAGDVVNYTITVKNTGNVSLSGVTVSDKVESYASVPLTLFSGDSDGDNKLDLNETWIYKTSYTLTQADLDNKGGGDGKLNNVATGDTAETDPPKDAKADVPLVYNPLITIAKNVKTDTTAGLFVPAELASGPQASLSSTVFFEVVLKNTGNITLTNITLTDVITHTPGGVQNLNYTAVNAQVDLDGNGTIDATWASLDGDNDGILETTSLAPNQTMKVYYSLTSSNGQHKNTATVDTSETTPIGNDANYYVLATPDGPGVRTPGFWQGPNNGSLFWNGIQDDSKTGTGFTKNGDLLIYGHTTGVAANGGKDQNGDNVVNAADRGLLIGDWNHDGITDPDGADNIVGTADDEDTIFISHTDAMNLVDAKGGDMNFGSIKLGRDTVATWLNYLAGNNIGEATDTNSPRHYIEDAVDWLQKFASVDGDVPGETSDVFKFVKVQNMTSSGYLTPIDGPGGHNGVAIHDALGGYNENGAINGIEYAGDADNSAFLFALQQVA